MFACKGVKLGGLRVGEAGTDVGEAGKEMTETRDVEKGGGEEGKGEVIRGIGGEIGGRKENSHGSEEGH